MRVHIVCAVFPPEPEPAGVMARQLALRLAADGHDVTAIVPFPNRPYGRVYDGYRRRLRETEDHPEGYRIVRCAAWLLGKERAGIHRLLENVTFGLTAAWALWRAGRPDIVIVETWPLFAVQFAALLAYWWRLPLLYYVQDVYPEALEFAGLIKRDGLLASVLRAWDRRLCMGRGRVVAISEGMKRLLCESRGLPNENVDVIPNWLDQSLFPPLPRDNGWREEMQITPERFLVLFAGTLGHVSGAEVLIDVARILKEHEDIQLLCVGEGVLKAGMVNAAREQGLTNIEFRPFQPAHKICQMHASADATLLTVQPGYPDASVPSKLITYLAAGRPVVCAASQASTAAHAVLTMQGGLVVDPGDAQAIAEALLTLSQSPAQAAAMGRNARDYFLAHYTMERAYRQFSELFSELTGAPA